MARAEEETNDCDECYMEAPVRQMSLSRGSLVCASCVTSRAARVLSTFHIRDPPKKTTETKKKNKENKKNKGNKENKENKENKKNKKSSAPRSASF